MVTKMEYEAIRTACEKADKAFQAAHDKFNKASDVWLEARISRNLGLPNGFYVEADAKLDPSTDDYPIYLKLDGKWYWTGDFGLSSVGWLDEEADFDIDMIPISEVKF